MEKLNDIIVNCTFKLGDLSPKLKKFILERGPEWTRHFRNTAQINGWTTKDLWNNNTVLGLRLYRDYFLCVDLVYPAYNWETYYTGQENPEIHYVPQEIGRFNKYDKTVSPDSSIENNWDTVHWLEDNDASLDELYKEITELFKGNFDLARDFDAEQLEEVLDYAIENNRPDLIDEIVGDRDLLEVLG